MHFVADFYFIFFFLSCLCFLSNAMVVSAGVDVTGCTVRQTYSRPTCYYSKSAHRINLFCNCSWCSRRLSRVLMKITARTNRERGATALCLWIVTPARGRCASFYSSNTTSTPKKKKIRSPIQFTRNTRHVASVMRNYERATGSSRLFVHRLLRAAYYLSRPQLAPQWNSPGPSRRDAPIAAERAAQTRERPENAKPNWRRTFISFSPHGPIVIVIWL